MLGYKQEPFGPSPFECFKTLFSSLDMPFEEKTDETLVSIPESFLCYAILALRPSIALVRQLHSHTEPCMVGGLSFVIFLSMAEIAAALPTVGGGDSLLVVQIRWS
jgi:hypothetical protein